MCRGGGERGGGLEDRIQQAEEMKPGSPMVAKKKKKKKSVWRAVPARPLPGVVQGDCVWRGGGGLQSGYYSSVQPGYDSSSPPSITQHTGSASFTHLGNIQPPYSSS